jgi:hypothetical protein
MFAGRCAGLVIVPVLVTNSAMPPGRSRAIDLLMKWSCSRSRKARVAGSARTTRSENGGLPMARSNGPDSVLRV